MTSSCRRSRCPTTSSESTSFCPRQQRASLRSSSSAPHAGASSSADRYFQDARESRADEDAARDVPSRGQGASSSRRSCARSGSSRAVRWASSSSSSIQHGSPAADLDDAQREQLVEAHDGAGVPRSRGLNRPRRGHRRSKRAGGSEQPWAVCYRRELISVTPDRKLPGVGASTSGSNVASPEPDHLLIRDRPGLDLRQGSTSPPCGHGRAADVLDAVVIVAVSSGGTGLAQGARVSSKAPAHRPVIPHSRG